MADILDAIREKAEALQMQLQAKVEANLSGDVLQTRSGALKNSIVAELYVSSDGVAVTLASLGVPYAAIQEHGGATGPHEILPTKAQALAFAGVFAHRVAHPGSAIPARSYLGSALEVMHADIVGGLKDAVRAALGAA